MWFINSLLYILHGFINPFALILIMAYGTNTEDINLTFTYLVLDTIKKMEDTAAANKDEEYSVRTEFALQLLTSYFPFNLRKRIDENFTKLRNEIKSIKANKDLNQISKASQILELRKDFSDTHRGFVFAALSKVGITKISEEGVIDLSVRDIKELSTAIRGGALIAAAEQITTIPKKEPEKVETKVESDG